jgi:hypothetical protein
MGSSPALRAPMREIFAGAIERGEIGAETDLELAIDTVVSLYGFNYLRAAEGADAQALTAFMDRELKLLFEGLTPR